MRVVPLLVLVIGCGPVRLGDELGDFTLDASVASGLDAALPIPELVVTVRPGAGCDLCFQMLAEARGAQPPYSFEWQDGLRDAQRTVCPDQYGATWSVSVEDANAQRSAPHVVRLESNDAACPPPPSLLCLQNRSFEGMPAANTGVPVAFDAAPWSDCSNPAQANSPSIINDTIPQMLAFVPAATDGLTYLGLAEGQQTSQRLCESLPGGSSVSLQLDLSRIDVSAGVVPDTRQGFLELWGGVASDCSRRELLWASPPQSTQWQTYCVTLKPQQFIDNLTLRAKADGSLSAPIYLVVDHLVPVRHCP